MPWEPTTKTSGTNRRDLIKVLGGSTAVVGLAGCLGDDDQTDELPGADDDDDDDDVDPRDDDDDTTPGDDPVQLVDQRATFYTSLMTNNPLDGHWNQLSPVGSFRSYYGMASLGKYSPFSDEFLLTGLEDFQKDGDRLSLMLRDNHTWFPSGDPVRAEDLRAKFVLEDITIGSELREGTVVDYDVVDDKQLDLVLEDANLREDLFMGGFLGDWIDLKASAYEEYLERHEDGEGDGLVEDIVDFRWENEDVELSGAYEPPELRDNSILFQTRTDDGKLFSGMEDGFPNETMYSEYQLHVVPRGQTEFQLVQQGDSLMTAFRGHEAELAPARDNPDLLTGDTPFMGSYVMQPNHSREHLDDVAVRQAIAYALDLDRAAEVAMSNNLAPIPYQMGTLGALGPDEYAHPDFRDTYDISYADYTPDIPIDSYREYGTESKMDEAAAVLQDAGYERNADDLWEDPDGNVVGPDILSSDIADFFLNQTLEWVESLQQLGFDTEIDSLPYDQFIDRLGSEDYDLTIVAWMPTAPFGYNVQSTTWLTSPRRDTDATGWVGDRPTQTQVPEYGDPDGSMIDVNVSEKLSQAEVEQDDDAYNRLISELCWIANESIPTIFCGEILDTVVADNANFRWPEVGSAEWPIEWWIWSQHRGVPLPRE